MRYSLQFYLFGFQVQLYEDFAKSQVKKGLDESVSHFDHDDNDTKQSKETPHIFQVGSCLRELSVFLPIC